MASATERQPIVSGPGQGEDYWFLGALTTIRATGEATGGSVAVIETLAPRGHGSPLHVHTREDEWFYVLEGELLLIENEGETIMRPGEAAGFKAGVANGHHLLNRTDRDAVYLEIGTRAKRERAHYPDLDLVAVKDEAGYRYTREDGSPP